ncbi:NAD-dependent epimerase/dehydratase family protein [Marinitoga litoralis]|uniref:NAD-dependent epimerase/dehydratase family protein n=1 Tax=Marinitoga litoralis TaxID=570855 RepID=UPI00195F7100|nr:NAD(P)-dependent oxidoreductase [Marinitoga litoralis]MBM7560306.1 nucleoside-diphosphate-sugar epimerase [Marinitoga litoralis]
MKIAVVGASGFIGGNVVKYLSGKGYEIISIYFTRPIEWSNTMNYTQFMQMNGRIDAIIFAGGNSNHKVDDKSLYEIIKKDSQYIQDILEKFEIPKAILLSSAAVYYGYEGYVDENVCPRPVINYGISKRISEMIFEKQARKSGVQGTVLRLTHAFGKEEKESRLFKSIAKSIIDQKPLKVYGGGESYINPVPIDFVCKVVDYFLRRDSMVEVDYYNLGSFKPLKVREIVESLKDRFDFEFVFEGEERHPVKFITKAEKLAQLGIVFQDVLENIIRYVESII